MILSYKREMNPIVMVRHSNICGAGVVLVADDLAVNAATQPVNNRYTHTVNI
jgi:hypothetical protein